MTINTHNSRRRTFIGLLVCFACSGMSGLIYEVAWVRSLELIFGATTFAVATVLAAFMGGLASGSYCMGLNAQRFARYHPLVVYGIIECMIGGFALVVPALFKFMIPLYQMVWSQFHASFVWFSLIRFLLCAAILLVPTFLMGATLPLMSSFVGNEPQVEGERRIGLLYAFNTAGAVLGCASAGLALFPSIGLARTQWVAMGLNFAAAAGAFLLARYTRLAATGKHPAPEATLSSTNSAPSEVARDSIADHSPRANGSVAARRNVFLLVGIYAVSGFSAMLYEVAWSRVLVLVLGSSTYAYTVMLTTFLLGLALGAYLATCLLGKMDHPVVTAGLSQVMIGLSTYLGIFMVEELPFLYLKTHELLHPTANGLVAVQFVLATGLMILPTLALGAMFPITIRGLNPSGSQTARLVGWAYALNTGGAILGSVLAGFWMVPQLGSRNCLLIGVAINAGLGMLAISIVSAGPLARYRRPLALLLLLFIANLFISTPQWHPAILSSGIFRYVQNYRGLDHQSFMGKLRENRGQILYFREGLTCTVTICRTLNMFSLLVNGKPDASVPSGLSNPYAPKPATSLGDLPTQIMLGQIPLLLAPKHENVLVIGLGSGVTLASVLRHPVKQVECIELEQAVVESSRFFDRYSGRPLADPRVKLVVNDARNHLVVTDQRYDVIISEPSNPWIAGAASLFTRDFFEVSKTRLRPDGVFCQWVQLYELHQNDFATILKTFTTVFPEVHVFRVEDDAILIGSSFRTRIDVARLKERTTPPAAADLARINIHSVEDFLAYYWIGGEELFRHLPNAVINTDDNMWIEFRAPLGLLARNEQEKEAQRKILKNLFQGRSTGVIPHVRLEVSDVRDRSQWWAALAEAALKRRLPEEARLYAAHSLAIVRSPLAGQVYGEALAQMGERQKARDWWNQIEREFPQAPEVLRSIAGFHAQESDWTATRDYAERLLAQMPTDVPGRLLLGQSLFYTNDWKGSLAILEPLASMTTAEVNLAELPFLLGSLYWTQNRFDDALEQFQRFLQRNPDHAGARALFADCLRRLGKQPEAVSRWQRVGRSRSEEANRLFLRGRVAWEQKQHAQALPHFEQAWQLDPWDDEINFYLARSRYQQGKVKETINQLEQYLSVDSNRPWALGFLSQLFNRQGDRERAQQLADYYHAATGQPWIDLRE